MREAGGQAAPAPLQLPVGGDLDMEFCRNLAAALDSATRQPPHLLPVNTLPAAACLALLKRAEKLLKAEPTLLHVYPPEGAEVVVVGDLHGQYHDLCLILSTVGYPSASLCFVFNGDFVDRGAWSVETLLLLLALKVAAPKNVALVRGNHESLYCSCVYGFKAEVQAKYGAEDEKQGTAVFSACRSLFAHLPLAAVVAGSALVLHGGLPRAPPRRAARRSLPDQDGVAVASLADIAASTKGGEDPEPERPDQRLAADVLWSDPSNKPGVELGARPGDVGIRFGPDVTEAFLRDNKLRLILRGHEGPDARMLRPDMQHMLEGYALDHDTPCGKLFTVFSAPLYPQFGQPQHQNLGAVAVLSAPHFDAPRFVQFSAAPRPQASPYIVPSDSQELAIDEEEAAGKGELWSKAGGAPGESEESSKGGKGASSSSSSEGNSEGNSRSEEEEREQQQEEVQEGLLAEAAKQAGSQDQSSCRSQSAEESSLAGTAGKRQAATMATAASDPLSGSSGSEDQDPVHKKQRLEVGAAAAETAAPPAM